MLLGINSSRGCCCGLVVLYIITLDIITYERGAIHFFFFFYVLNCADDVGFHALFHRKKKKKIIFIITQRKTNGEEKINTQRLRVPRDPVAQSQRFNRTLLCYKSKIYCAASLTGFWHNASGAHPTTSRNMHTTERTTDEKKKKEKYARKPHDIKPRIKCIARKT